MSVKGVQAGAPACGEDSAGPSADFRWLITVDQAYEQMIAAIDNAVSTIRLETYTYRDSEIGITFRDALVRACHRGVKVKLLIDAFGSIGLDDEFFDDLRAANGTVLWFNPIKLRRIGFRNHRKALIIDEELAFIGGFNIGPEYQGDGWNKGWHDIGCRLTGPLVAALTKTFEIQDQLADYRHGRLARFRRSKLTQIYETAAGQLLTSAPGRGRHQLLRSLRSDTALATRVDIISAYFLPPRPLRRALIRAARDGRTVRLILAGQSDVPLAQRAAHYLYTHLMRFGIQIYEYEPQVLHTKLFLFDDVVYVGSANMDKRSLLVNYELLVRMQDAAVAEEARAFFERTLEHSKRVDPAEWNRSRSIWRKLKESWSYFALSKVDPYLVNLQLRILLRRIPTDS